MKLGQSRPELQHRLSAVMWGAGSEEEKNEQLLQLQIEIPQPTEQRIACTEHITWTCPQLTKNNRKRMSGERRMVLQLKRVERDIDALICDCEDPNKSHPKKSRKTDAGAVYLYSFICTYVLGKLEHLLSCE